MTSGGSKGSGWKHSEESKVKMRKEKSAKCSETECMRRSKAYSGEGNPMYGKHASDLCKQKTRDTHSKPVICIDDGTIYASGKALAEKLGVSKALVSTHLCGKTKRLCLKKYSFINSD